MATGDLNVAFCVIVSEAFPWLGIVLVALSPETDGSAGPAHTTLFDAPLSLNAVPKLPSVPRCRARSSLLPPLSGS